MNEDQIAEILADLRKLIKHAPINEILLKRVAPNLSRSLDPTDGDLALVRLYDAFDDLPDDRDRAAAIALLGLGQESGMVKERKQQFNPGVHPRTVARWADKALLRIARNLSAAAADEAGVIIHLADKGETSYLGRPTYTELEVLLRGLENPSDASVRFIKREVPGGLRLIELPLLLAFDRGRESPDFKATLVSQDILKWGGHLLIRLKNSPRPFVTIATFRNHPRDFYVSRFTHNSFEIEYRMSPGPANESPLSPPPRFRPAA